MNLHIKTVLCMIAVVMTCNSPVWIGGGGLSGQEQGQWDVTKLAKGALRNRLGVGTEPKLVTCIVGNRVSLHY